MKYFILFLLFSGKVLACSCTEIPSYTTNWNYADQVFSALIVKKETKIYGLYGEKINSYTCKILNSYKGELLPNQNYRTLLGKDAASCDFEFKVGKTYLIFANENGLSLYCSVCSRTSLLENVPKDSLNILTEYYQKSQSDTGPLVIKRLESNTAHQVRLATLGYKEALNRKNRIIYGLLIGIAVFIIVIGSYLLIKRKK
ncbi:hypothetical protein [Flavobacterium stagni]|uniref:Tissue inhibitor of metalloproteinase n=1 Tax=Flavobacterium stagni TaxID=2506421 RepID=A0A4Q1KB71_9FLAO|nr:hypothetical protein [Flavobacterium stagni]RXR22145.1 hypothetical protein EQG61_09080 [Flavobacterium stagni]